MRINTAPQKHHQSLPLPLDTTTMGLVVFACLADITDYDELSGQEQFKGECLLWFTVPVYCLP